MCKYQNVKLQPNRYWRHSVVGINATQNFSFAHPVELHCLSYNWAAFTNPIHRFYKLQRVVTRARSCTGRSKANGSLTRATAGNSFTKQSVSIGVRPLRPEAIPQLAQAGKPLSTSPGSGRPLPPSGATLGAERPSEHPDYRPR